MRTQWIARMVALAGIAGAMAVSSAANAVQVSMTVDSTDSGAGYCTLTLTNHVQFSDSNSIWKLENRMIDGTAVESITLSKSGLGDLTDTWTVTLTATDTVKMYSVSFHDEGQAGLGPGTWSGDTNATNVKVRP